MYIVGFNGPPESGKDTLADMVANKIDKAGVSLPVRMESLSLPLRSIAYAMVGRHYYNEGSIGGQPHYAEFKRESFTQLNRTGRQLMIDASESFLKPVYGIEVMAKLLLDRNVGFLGILLIRDCGFQCEVDPLIRHVGADNLYMVQVTRPDKSFVGDSREWVYHPQTNRRSVVANDGTLADLETEADRIYSRLVNQCGWKL